MLVGEIARVEAGALSILNELDQCAHAIDRKAKFATAANEVEPRHILVSIGALTSRLSLRAWQQTDLFVVADCRSIGSRAGRQCADS
jgi:hypothetical protein